MGFFKRLTDSSFKVNGQGNTLFYPWGILGRGYILPDIETEKKDSKIYNILSLYRADPFVDYRTISHALECRFCVIASNINFSMVDTS